MGLAIPKPIWGGQPPLFPPALNECPIHADARGCFNDEVRYVAYLVRAAGKLLPCTDPISFIVKIPERDFLM